MLTSLRAALFGPNNPRCPGTGSKLIAQRRAALDEKYTARPLDFFPNPLVSREQLEAARAEGAVMDAIFEKYKREAKCSGESMGGFCKMRRCEGPCGEWCCDACRFHTSYRIVCSFPLLFSDAVAIPPDHADHVLIAPDKRSQDVQIRIREHEHPYLDAMTQQFAQRWHGYCHNCLPRVSASLIGRLDDACKCGREHVARKYRSRWLCAGCFEEECREYGIGFTDRTCQGRGCGRRIEDIGWSGFQPVCGWCYKIIDGSGMDVALKAHRESEDFRVSRKDPRKNSKSE